ncbi:MAG: hypothetical protein KF802_02800 [Bdellovibrionaceae bacterium]|nr:hypothetical protein [Pseudobdellovibrionaceae bacterium]
MMTFTEAEVAERIKELNNIEDTELRECAFNFWCEAQAFMKITNSRVLIFEIIRGVNDGPYGAVIQMSNRYGLTSVTYLSDFAPETIECIRFAEMV